jgi:hypothetical protein
MQRTDVQQKIEDALIRLLKEYPRIVSVQMISLSNNERGLKSGAKRHGERIVITLVEPEMPNDLADWGEAIVRAEEFLELIHQDVYHDFTRPNFFAALRSKLNYHGLINTRYE